MPCIIPTCNQHEGTMIQFPSHDTLAERWFEAIQLGTGLGMQIEIDPAGLEICDSHFPPALFECGSSYREPSRFMNCFGHHVEVSSCRLCMAFYDSSEMISPEAYLEGKPIAAHVYESLNIILQSNGMLKLICQECFTRIEIINTIKRKSAETELAYEQLVRIGQAKEHQLVKVEVDVKEEMTLDYTEMYDEEDSIDEWKPNESELSLGDTENIPRRGSRRVKTDLPKENAISPIKIKDQVKKTCYICVTVFADANELLLHLTEKHTTKTTYRCEECSLDIPVLVMYNRHLSRHSETERPHKCNDCPLRFASANHCKKHENRVHGGKHNVKIAKNSEIEIVCEVCGKKFSHRGRLNDHIQKVHLKVGIPKCSICERTFTAKFSLERHMLLHTSENPYTCDQCGVSFRRLLDMRHHKSIVHERRNPHVCTECNEEFKSYQALYFHRQRVHLKLTKNYVPKPHIELIEICKLCQKQVATCSELIKHIEQTHENEEYPMIKCAVCPKTFYNTNRLSQHKSIHTDKFACAVCGARHTNSQRLQFHMEAKHPDGRTFDCPTCGNTYTTSRRLAVHVAIHNKEKNLQCEFCPKVFRRKCQLNIHRRIHTGEKPFECVGCLKRFGDDGTFCNHKKRCKAFKAKSEHMDDSANEEN
ncbi:zinc finger protein 883-like [Topomyia yanbarensis]|uniref:zinc finger protein 883-like n=1 Tax=Topomyia yanbarensis TaxID=2498891 RepID=UPI00273CA802|nr:zinc finger protein 883-like [Topomyia yanbarensis]